VLSFQHFRLGLSELRTSSEIQVAAGAATVTWGHAVG